MNAGDRQIRETAIADLATMKSQVEDMHRILLGNGEAGLVERMRMIEIVQARQFGIVAGISATASLMVSVLGWKLQTWFHR